MPIGPPQPTEVSGDSPSDSITVFDVPSGRSAATYLSELCEAGLAGRYGTITAEIRERLSYELSVIGRMGFDEALTGLTLPLRLTSEAPCAVCAGTGAKAGTTPRLCPTCQGAGQVNRNAGGFAFPEPCRECRGRGRIVDDPCPSCRGGGTVTRTKLNAAGCVQKIAPHKQNKHKDFASQ